jgi:hypothetical protein
LWPTALSAEACILTGNVADIGALRPGGARRNMPRFQGDNLRRNRALVEQLKKHAAAKNCTPPSCACLGFVTGGLHRADPRHQLPTSARGKLPSPHR